MAVAIAKGKKHTLEFMYDFAENGGAVSSISLVTADVNSIAALPEGFLVEGVEVITETTITSAGTPTITVGPTADVDGYLADIFGVAATAGAVVRSGEVAGALLWDDTNDHEISYRVTGTANTQDIVVAIGTAAVTAGKFRVLVHGYMPSARVLI